MYRVSTDDGSKTTTALVEHALRAGVQVHSLQVQHTTLDDVFVHYTGRALRDAAQSAFAYMPAVKW
jgi:ABC-2 type transport system ATP-binding protein